MVSAFRPGVEDMDMGEMPAAVYALRHLAAVTEIRRYLDTHPEAAAADTRWGPGPRARGGTGPSGRRSARGR